MAKETNTFVNSHLLATLNEFRDMIIAKMNSDIKWHEKEAQIAFKLVLAELEHNIHILKEDIPKEYLKKCVK